MDLEPFRLRLAETIAWCSGRASAADPKHSLRTVDLLPTTVRERDEWFHHWKPAELETAVEAVAEARARQLRMGNRYPSVPAENLAGGCLLIFEPDSSLNYGICEWESAGFFDRDDFPPWDTWLCAVNESENSVPYLLSWVPPVLIEWAHRGVEISADACVFWAATYDQQYSDGSPFLYRLDGAGLLGEAPEMTEATEVAE